jgi:UDP-N-acetylmuramate dehydrogenase
MTLISFIKNLTCDVKFDEPMSRHTSFKIGGNADVMIFPKTTDELIYIRNTCKEENVPLTVLGDGANVLVSDDGIRGVVVFTNKMANCEILQPVDDLVKSCRVQAQSGLRLSALAIKACEAGLSGLAFASGIPGTVGGAICMNAGAYGHDISEFIESVTLYTNGEKTVKTREEMGFGYRKSIVQGGDVLVLDATFALSQGNPAEIREEMKTLNAKRKKSQPLEYHSAGSFFKRPEGNYAGKLIEDSGLKGFNINDAWVSEKHAGFVVNKGNATANEIIQLMHHVQKTVFEKFGVKLEPEVRILGF